MISDLNVQDSNQIQQYFSSEKEPTLWRALPALEELQTAWEKKRDNPKYALYKDALSKGLDKIGKYYSLLDDKPSFVLALSRYFSYLNECHILIYSALHPYYKLAYIKHSWGGPNEQAAEIADGNADPKDWQDEANKLVEKTVSHMFYSFLIILLTNITTQMAEYYENRPTTAATNVPTNQGDAVLHAMSDFDKHRETLLSDDATEGWASELRRYLGTMQ
jgi:hypothetical protein